MQYIFIKGCLAIDIAHIEDTIECAPESISIRSDSVARGDYQGPLLSFPGGHFTFDGNGYRGILYKNANGELRVIGWAV